MATRSSLIKGITIEIDGDVTKLNKALGDVSKTLSADKAALSDVDRLLKLDPGNTELLQQKFNLLSDSIEASKSKLETLRTASEQAVGKLSTGDMTQAEFDALQREIVETEQKLKGLEKEFKNFGSVAAQQVAAAGEKVKDVGGKIEGVGKAIMPASIAAAGAATVAVTKFADFDKTINLTNETMGNTEEEANHLKTAIKKAAAQSVFSMSDAANATLNYARAGLSAEEAADALAPAMNLAAGEGGNLDTVSAGLVGTINGFHDTFAQAGYYADVFAAACNNSQLDVDSLCDSIGVVAPIFNTAGYSIRDAALYLGVLADNDIDASVAANSLKTGLARLVKPAKEGGETMDQLGISVTNADGTMKDAITIQRELHDVFMNLSRSEQIAAASAIFGKNQMAPWLALINTAPEDVWALNDSLVNCAGTTNQMAEAMMEGFGGSLERLKSSIDVLITSLGEAMAPTIQKVADAIQGLVDKFNALPPEQQEVMAKIIMITAVAGPLLIVIGKVVAAAGQILVGIPRLIGLFQNIISIVGLLGKGLSLLWGVLIANPIGLIVAAITAVVGAFVYLWNTSEGFRNFWINLWETIKSAVSTAVEAVIGFGKNMVESIAGFFKSMYEGASSALSGLGSAVSNAFANIKNIVGGAISSAFNWGKDLVAGIANGIKSAIGWVKDAASSVADAIRNFLHFSRPDEGPLREYESWMPDFMKGLASSIESNKHLVTDAMKGLSSDMSMNINGNLQSNTGSQNTLAAMSAMIVQYLPYLPQIANMQVRLDDGALVGKMAAGMDAEFGTMSYHLSREAAY